MIRADQHVPGFVDADRRHAEAATLDELLVVDWIASWATSTVDRDVPHKVISWDKTGAAVSKTELMHMTGHTFHRWSLSDNCLMAEYDNGDYFWVVAYLTSKEPIALPQWVETENARRKREKWNRGEL